jgi:hypothetical protein
MNSLATVLARYAEPNPAAVAGGTRGKSIDRDQLRADLQNVSKGSSRYFALCAILVVVLFALAVLIILLNIDNANAIRQTLSACGISAGGLIAWMVRITKLKQSAEMLATLAAYVDESTLKTIVTVLARQLAGKDAGSLLTGKA